MVAGLAYAAITYASHASYARIRTWICHMHRSNGSALSVTELAQGHKGRGGGGYHALHA
jgi:hypothetical protein